MASGKTRRSAVGPYAALANILWRHRREIGLTQKNAANALGIPLRDLRRIESGLSLPDAPLREAMAKVLAVPIDTLFGDIPEIEETASKSQNRGSRVAGNPIDRHVGNRLFMRRVEQGFSQERLAEALGISFQQVQKYERGINRISASRLYDICRILQVDLNFFFEGVPRRIASPTSVAHQAWHDDPVSYEPDRTESRGQAELLGAFRQISSLELRRGLIDLARAIAKLDMTAPGPNTTEASKKA